MPDPQIAARARSMHSSCGLSRISWGMETFGCGEKEADITCNKFKGWCVAVVHCSVDGLRLTSQLNTFYVPQHTRWVD